jgi:RNA recognition motif-containing protein
MFNLKQGGETTFVMENNKRLFVGNLAADVSEEDLKEQFSYFGNVLFLRIIEHKRIGFVEMFNPADAYRARMGLNGIVFHGRYLRVEEAHPRNRNARSYRESRGEQKGSEN